MEAYNYLLKRVLSLVPLGLLLLAPCAAEAQNLATVKVSLIYASNEPAALDARLDRIEFQLRRVLKFEHYRFMSQRALTLGEGASAEAGLGEGCKVRLEGVKVSQGHARLRATWLQGGQQVMQTTVNLKRGAATVLGGHPHKQGALVVSLEMD